MNIIKYYFFPLLIFAHKYCDPNDCIALCKSQYASRISGYNVTGICETDNNNYCRCYYVFRKALNIYLN